MNKKRTDEDDVEEKRMKLNEEKVVQSCLRGFLSFRRKRLSPLTQFNLRNNKKKL
jgi:hypothetical protein